MSKFKDKLLNEFDNAPIKVGDCGYIKKSLIYSFSNENSKCYAKVNAIDGDNIIVECPNERSIVKIKSSDFSRSKIDVGYNPFNTSGWITRVRNHMFDIEGIMLDCGFEKTSKSVRMEQYYGISVNEVNFNPYVIDGNGNKFYYQRDFVWSDDDKKLFIDSLYNGLNCGSVILRKRSYEWIERQIKLGNIEVAFKDIVDGKQRLHTLFEFFMDKFTDSNGYYYSDLSIRAQNMFNRLTTINYITLDEDTTDDETINCFILTNSGGVTISKEHINKVKNYLK